MLFKIEGNICMKNNNEIYPLDASFLSKFPTANIERCKLVFDNIL